MLASARCANHFWVGLALLAPALQCSAGGGAAPGAGVDLEGADGPGHIEPGGSTPSGADPFLLGDDGQAVDANGNPLNIGSELACDGIDENQNGIIDDVDRGRDGLCDCLRIGFLGALASDAGNQTGAFEAWLEERSDVPVTHIGARETLTAELLSDLQVLIIGNVAERGDAGYPAPEVEALRQWIDTEGGGLMSLAGYTARETDVVPTTSLLAPLGLGYDYQGRGPGVLGMGQAPPVLVRGLLAPEHPVLDGISVLGVYLGYPVTGDGEVLVREGTFDLAMAKVIGTGHVLAFADEWITQDALWYPMMNRALTPCEQGCTQCTTQCVQCDQQCADCQQQPCAGGELPAADGTCARGCDQACQACSTNCESCEQTCADCSALEQQDQLDIPRFWLNALRWLTPANECQVPIPPRVVF